MPRHMDGFLRQILNAKELHHQRHFGNAHTRNIAQTRSLNTVTSDSRAVLRNNNEHDFAAGTFQFVHKGLQIVQEADRSGLEFFPTTVARQAVAVMQSDEIKERHMTSRAIVLGDLLVPIPQHSQIIGDFFIVKCHVANRIFACALKRRHQTRLITKRLKVIIVTTGMVKIQMLTITQLIQSIHDLALGAPAVVK